MKKKSYAKMFANALLACLMPLIALTAKGQGIKGDKATLDVVVCRSDSLGTSAEWTPVSTNTVEVPAPGEQGFFILKSKPAVPSNRSGRPDTADVQHD